MPSKNKKLQKKEDIKNPVHVQLETPVYLRKSVLKTAIDATKLIQNVHEIGALRQKELILVNKLRKTMIEIKNLNKDFNKVMPQILEYHEEEFSDELTSKVEETQEANELIKLKRELEMIEGKLKEFE